jgi:hypothetical protein
MINAKKHHVATKILCFCIASGLHEQKKSVVVIFLDFRDEPGMHP